MSDYDSYNDPNRNGITGRKVMFAGLLVVLAALVYVMFQDINKLPTETASQTRPLMPTRHKSAPEVVPLASLAPSAKAPAGQTPAAEAHEIDVGFRVAGRIDKMFFAEGAQVKQGEILATLDKVPLQQALDAAKAQLELAKAQSGKPAHVSDDSFHEVEAARANVETAQHTYDEAHTELQKRRQLITAGAMKDNVYNDDVQNEHDTQLALERARRELAHQEDVAGVHDDHAVDKASTQAAEANVAIAETNLADAELHAPSAGTISHRVSTEGANVAAGGTVYTLVVQ